MTSDADAVLGEPQSERLRAGMPDHDHAAAVIRMRRRHDVAAALAQQRIEMRRRATHAGIDRRHPDLRDQVEGGREHLRRHR